MEQCQQCYERVLIMDKSFKGISANTKTTSKMVFNSGGDRSRGHGMDTRNNTPRGFGPVGRVQKVNKGKYNVVRSCLVKTSKGDFVKPAIKLSLINDKST